MKHCARHVKFGSSRTLFHLVIYSKTLNYDSLIQKRHLFTLLVFFNTKCLILWWNMIVFFSLLLLLHWIGPLGHLSPRFVMSVCLWQFKTPTSRCPGDFWSKGILLILACNDIILVLVFSFFSCFNDFFVFFNFWSVGYSSQPTFDNGGLSRGMVCCCGFYNWWQVTKKKL